MDTMVVLPMLLLLVLLPAGLASINMSFYAVAVGQGDSCIIECPNHRDIVVIDMGARAPQYVTAAYVTYLLKERFHAAKGGMRLHVIISHPHIDHYSFMTRALDSDLLVNLQEVILGGKYADYSVKARSWLEDKGNVYTVNNEKKCFGNSNCILTSAKTGLPMLHDGKHDPWQLCSNDTRVNFTVLGANIGTKSNINGQSIVLKIQYSSWSMLTSGDFEGVTAQKELMKMWPASAFKSTYYKIAHHGAWTDRQPNMPKLLDLIQPKKVYISHGSPCLHGYRHPNISTYEHLVALSSIAKINISSGSNNPFVYWDMVNKKCVPVEGGLDRAIYETCPQFIFSNKTQVCKDLWITTDGEADEMVRVAVPSRFLHKPRAGPWQVGEDWKI